MGKKPPMARDPHKFTPSQHGNAQGRAVHKRVGIGRMLETANDSVPICAGDIRVAPCLLPPQQRRYTGERLTLRLMDYTSRLPDELLSEVLSHTDDFAAIVSMSHVCGRWRPIARSQHAFAGEIEMDSDHFSSQSSDLLDQRLAASTRALHMQALIGSDSELNTSHVLPRIHDNMRRVQELMISIEDATGLRCLLALTQPAPMLRKLQIHFPGGLPELTPEGWSALFAGSAPRLTHLSTLR